MKTKVGLLIDLNSFPRFSKEDDYFNDENSPVEDGFSTSSSAAELCPLDLRLEAKLDQLQEYILEQLTRDGTVRGKFNCSDFQFTYRYFNSSCYSHPAKELRSFIPFNVASFDAFEKSLEAEVRNLCANGDPACQDTNKMSLMSSAFKGMVSDFEWDNTTTRKVDSIPRVSSSSSVKSSDSISPLTDSIDESTRNVLYVFFRVPRDIQQMEQFVDDLPDKLDVATSSKQFLNAFVSKAFLDTITRTYQMRVNFVDMWALHDNNDEDVRKSYPNAILKVLRHLHGGQIFQPCSNMSMTPGLPSWKVFLKNNLKANSMEMISSSVRAIDSETTHVSESSFCSTPVNDASGLDRYLKFQSISQTMAPGSANKTISRGSVPGSNNSTRLRKDVLLKSQSQSSLTSHSSLKRLDAGRIQKRFSSSNSNQTILVRKSSGPIVLPTLSRDSFLRRKSTDLIESLSTSCPNPKKVRRNLFTASCQEPSEEIKRLLASTATFNFSRSPRSPHSSRSGSLPRSLFGSPKETSSSPLIQPEFKSPGSSNVLKTRRRLDLNHHSGAGSSRSTSLTLSPLSMTMGLGYGTASPVHVLSGIICPESPATPPTKRMRTGSFTISSCEKVEVIQESPEAHHSRNVFKKAQFTRHDSFTFYSSSSSESLSSKSRAWEQSGKKLQAARIKDSHSVDLSRIVNSSLSLDDLELLDPAGSPLTNETNTELPSS